VEGGQPEFDEASKDKTRAIRLDKEEKKKKTQQKLVNHAATKNGRTEERGGGTKCFPGKSFGDGERKDAKKNCGKREE